MTIPAVFAPIAQEVEEARDEIGEAVAISARRVVDHATGWFADRIARGADGAVRAAETIVDTRRDNVRRVREQQRENVREIGSAVARVASTRLDSVRELRDEVAAAWRDQPTIERRVVVAGYEVVENAIQGAIRSHQARVDVMREVREAAHDNVMTGWRNLGESVRGNLRAAGELLGGIFG